MVGFVKMKTYYTFDDIFVFPNYSTLHSRSEADTSTHYGNLKLDLPIISSNMDTITNAEMAITMRKYGALSALHRFMSIEDNVTEYKKVVEAGAECLVSVGVSGDYLERINALYGAGARYLLIDVAHGHHELVKNTIYYLRNKWENGVHITAGNVATPEAVYDLAKWGANIVKINIGSGSPCQTKLVTGIGLPSFSCICDCAEAADENEVKLIADGGIRHSGDFFKSFVAGASYCMGGRIFAGTDEASSPLVANQLTGKLMKIYRGNASRETQLILKKEVKHVEGVSTLVDLKGPVREVINEFKYNLQSSMSYINARTISDISIKAKWGVQTNNGQIEGKPHILM